MAAENGVKIWIVHPEVTDATVKGAVEKGMALFRKHRRRLVPIGYPAHIDAADIYAPGELSWENIEDMATGAMIEAAETAVALRGDRERSDASIYAQGEALRSAAERMMVELQREIPRVPELMMVNWAKVRIADVQLNMSLLSREPMRFTIVVKGPQMTRRLDEELEKRLEHAGWRVQVTYEITDDPILGGA